MLQIKGGFKVRNSVNSFMQREKDLDIELNKGNIDSIDSNGSQYRTLQIGGYLTLFMSDEQLRQLLTTLDEELNEVTYSDLQENLDTANDTIETLREQAVSE